MFTGMIEARGQITAIDRWREFTRIRIVSDLDLQDLRVGDSIAVNGACLTATLIDPSRKEFAADVSPETMRVSTLADFKIGEWVNLEDSLRLNSRIGGHLVLGHVDCVGRVVEKRAVGEGFLMGFLADSGRYLIEKGSVAVDGVSLTVNKVQGGRFWVMIIPHTATLTGLTEKKVNDRVNLEFDIIGKYVEKFVGSRRSDAGVDERTLKDYGFI
jgi:riboflavin synthase